MKKLIAFLLALALIPAVSAAETAREAPAVFDTSGFEQHSELFDIRVGEDGAAVITALEASADRTFTTPYMSEKYPGTVYPDLVVLGYPTEERRASLRIRIRYNGTKQLNFSSVTFITDRYEYTFPDLSGARATTVREDGVFGEDLVIVTGGGEGMQFLADLLTRAMEYANNRYGEEKDAQAALPAWSLILHGDEDLTVTLPEGFWTDLGLFAVALDSMNELSFLARNEGWPCEITQIK